MDKLHLLSTLIIVRLLDIIKDPFYPQEKDGEFFGDETSYVIKALIYLANYPIRYPLKFID